MSFTARAHPRARVRCGAARSTQCERAFSVEQNRERLSTPLAYMYRRCRLQRTVSFIFYTYTEHWEKVSCSDSDRASVGQMLDAFGYGYAAYAVQEE